MKKSKILLAICVLFSISLVACKNEKKKPDVVDEMVAKSKAKTSTNAEQEAPTSKELKLGDNKLIYLSNYAFVKNVIMTEKINTPDNKTVEAAYYDLTIPKSIGKIGVNYSKQKVKPSLDGAINGLLQGYKKLDYVAISDEKLEDISDKLGHHAKMGSGKMSINTTEDGLSNGEFIYMVLQKGNELLLFQGIFKNAGTEHAKNFQEMLENIKLTSSN